MNCATCKSDIENDSFYCDQCGIEIFICPTCGKTGKGKNCIEDGSRLFSPKQKSGTTAPIEIQNQNNAAIISPPISILNQATPAPLKVQPLDFNDNPPITVLRLINNHLRIDIEMKNGDIIGRTAGGHVNTFCQFSQISGQHAQFLFQKDNSWAIRDLGSTNGSAINNSPNWQNISKLKPLTLAVLANNSFLLLANIEFQIKIISQSTSSGTQRL